MKVLNGTEQLEEIVSSETLIEPTLLILDLNERKEIPLLNKFKHNKEYLNRFSTWLYDYLTIAIVLHQFDYVRMVHCLNQVHFIGEYLLES